MKFLKLKDNSESVINLEKALSFSLTFENRILLINFQGQNEEEKYYYKFSEDAESDYNRLLNL